MTAKAHNGLRLLGLICLLSASGTFAAEAGYDELVQQALQQRNNGHFAEAEATLQQARPMARETNEVDYLLGMMQAFQERFIEARQTLEASLERYPDDTSLQLGRARVLSYQGIYDEAMEAVNRILASEPENMEALTLRGRIYFYQSRHNLAREDFQAVLAIQPDNLEAVIGLYDVALARNDDEAADQYLQQAREIAPQHVDVVTRVERLRAPVQRPHLLTVSGGFSDFDRSGFQRWYDRAVDYRYLFDSGNEFLLRGQHSHRFGLHDSLMEIGFRFARPGNIPVEVAIAHTPDQDFLPREQLRVSSLFTLNNAGENYGATTLDATLYHSRYANGNVSRISLGFTHYLLNVNAWLTPGVGLVRDENGDQDFSWTLGAHWQVNARLRLGYDYTDAPETENSITTQTWSHHVYGQYQIRDGVALRLDYSDNERDRAYTRDALSLALILQF